MKMTTAISKAWEINLKLPKEDQWESKEEIIENYCPNSCEIGLDLKEPKCCPEEYNKGLCMKCWNRLIKEEDVNSTQETNTEENISNKLTFDKLKESPINEMYFSDMTENNFIKSLKNAEYIINCEDGTLTYDDIPKTIKWLQDVYSLANKLKNKVEYINFITAKEYMLKGNKSKFEDEVYYIKNDELYCEDLKSACALKLRAIESDKWILL